MKRSAIAQETVAICEAGSYIAPDGGKVWLESSIREAKAKTALYSPENPPAVPALAGSANTKRSVTSETTLGALIRMSGEPGGHLACLNFASAKNPGGGFLGGAEAQEESLARSSALYPCLLSARGYYERNRACGTALYLDLAIWSPAVPFFRDDCGALLAQSVRASVITAPAPNAGAVAANEPHRAPEIEPCLARRAAMVLAIAAAQGVRRLVLGAWGCGVFRNDPRMVAQVFASLLGPPGTFAGAFDEVVFAIYDKSPEQAVVQIFAGDQMNLPHKIVEGDLLEQDVEVIVNPWNRNIIPWWLLLPQGVSGAIKQKAGLQPFVEVARHGAIPLGHAVLTSAGKLPYRGMIHVAGIDMLWRASENSIRDSVQSVFAVMHEHGFSSVAFPVIGAGSGGFSREQALQFIREEILLEARGVRAVVVRYSARR